MTNSLWPHRLQSIRLLCPWDFPGKETGVSCHFLLQGIFISCQQFNMIIHLCPCIVFSLEDYLIFWAAEEAYFQSVVSSVQEFIKVFICVLITIYKHVLHTYNYWNKYWIIKYIKELFSEWLSSFLQHA